MCLSLQLSVLKKIYSYFMALNFFTSQTHKQPPAISEIPRGISKFVAW